MGIDGDSNHTHRQSYYGIFLEGFSVKQTLYFGKDHQDPSVETFSNQDRH